jgi:hypothetical protein
MIRVGGKSTCGAALLAKSGAILSAESAARTASRQTCPPLSPVPQSIGTGRYATLDESTIPINEIEVQLAMNTLLDRRGVEEAAQEFFREPLVGGHARCADRNAVHISLGPLSAVDDQYQYLLLISAGCPTRSDLIGGLKVEIKDDESHEIRQLGQTNRYGKLVFDGIVPGRHYQLQLAASVELATSSSLLLSTFLPLAPSDLSTKASSRDVDDTTSSALAGYSIDWATFTLSVVCSRDETEAFQDIPLAWVQLFVECALVGQGGMLLSRDVAGRYIGEAPLTSFGKNLHEHGSALRPQISPAVEAEHLNKEMLMKVAQHLNDRAESDDVQIKAVKLWIERRLR